MVIDRGWLIDRFKQGMKKLIFAGSLQNLIVELERMLVR